MRFQTWTRLLDFLTLIANNHGLISSNQNVLIRCSTQTKLLVSVFQIRKGCDEMSIIF